MGSTFLTTVKTLLRAPSMIIWCLVFPVVLSSIFMFMFSNLASDGTVDPVSVAVVEDGAWEKSNFSEVVDALDDEGADQLLVVTPVQTREEGEDLVDNGAVSGVYSVSDTGQPELTIPSDSSGVQPYSSINSTILENIADSYLQNYDLVSSSFMYNPGLLLSPGGIDEVLDVNAPVEQVSLTRSTPDETVRFYYALLAMVALLAGSQGAAGAVDQAQPTTSALGARRSIAKTSRGRQLLAIMLGSWAVACALELVAFAYIRFVVGIDFVGREGLCIAGIAAATLAATALGALVGALPVKGGPGTRSGILLCLTLGLSLFAGLYGEGALQLADHVAQVCPAEAWLNPARLTSDLFYSLYYYGDLGPFAARLSACLAMAAALFGVAAILFRRQRHDHL